jgi:SOS response regulatory protein OraA/RecX
MPRVTALRERPGDRILVELDGREWRVVPADAVVRARLRNGLDLDRPRLRLFRRELRRSEALAVAARALRVRDLSTRALADRLAKAGIPPAVRVEALRVLADTGIADDARVAASAARALADRGWGDTAIAFRLEELAVDRSATQAALADLEPEPERAARVVERRGRSAATARLLTRRGFREDVIEGALQRPLADQP